MSGQEGLAVCHVLRDHTQVIDVDEFLASTELDSSNQCKNSLSAVQFAECGNKSHPIDAEPQTLPISRGAV